MNRFRNLTNYGLISVSAFLGGCESGGINLEVVEKIIRDVGPTAVATILKKDAISKGDVNEAIIFDTVEDYSRTKMIERARENEILERKVRVTHVVEREPYETVEREPTERVAFVNEGRSFQGRPINSYQGHVKQGGGNGFDINQGTLSIFNEGIYWFDKGGRSRGIEYGQISDISSIGSQSVLQIETSDGKFSKIYFDSDTNVSDIEMKIESAQKKYFSGRRKTDFESLKSLEIFEK
ncbi:MAG: hypothetical protein WDZ77_00305 [Candidatus Pacearchaeota archaeon]